MKLLFFIALQFVSFSLSLVAGHYNLVWQTALVIFSSFDLDPTVHIFMTTEHKIIYKGRFSCRMLYRVQEIFKPVKVNNIKHVYKQSYNLGK